MSRGCRAARSYEAKVISKARGECGVQVQVRGQWRRSKRVFLCSHPTALPQIQSHSRLPPVPILASVASLGPEHCRAVYSARSVAQMFKQESDSGKEGKAVTASREARERVQGRRQSNYRLSALSCLAWLACAPSTPSHAVCRLSSHCPLPCFYAHIAPPPAPP